MQHTNKSPCKPGVKTQDCCQLLCHLVELLCLSRGCVEVVLCCPCRKLPRLIVCLSPNVCSPTLWCGRRHDDQYHHADITSLPRGFEPLVCADRAAAMLWVVVGRVVVGWSTLWNGSWCANYFYVRTKLIAQIVIIASSDDMERISGTEKTNRSGKSLCRSQCNG